MAIKGSGPLSFTDITAEFSDTPPHSLSEFYRGGGKVPSVNTNVPTSGTISFANFYNAVNEILVQATSASSVNAQTLFGSNWGSAVPKRLLVPSGSTIGPLTIPSGLVGDLIVQNEGEIQGLGGGPNGGAGGHAITASSSFTLQNFGAIRGGGGGGGKGGNGGNGESWQVQSSKGPWYRSNGSDPAYPNDDIIWMADIPPTRNWVAVEWREQNEGPYGLVESWWLGVDDPSQLHGPTGDTIKNGNIWYIRGALMGDIGGGEGGYAVTRQVMALGPTSGGAGGNGGVGRGYNQSIGAGIGGAAGGENAGTGGKGGDGGNWATNGATGATGAAGNKSGGAAGAGGGAAGRAVLMNAGSLTVSSVGLINGAY